MRRILHIEHWEDFKYTKERPIRDKTLVIDDHLEAAKDLWNQLMNHWEIKEEYLETSKEHWEDYKNTT